MKLKGILFAIISSIIFGTTGIIQKPLYLDNVNPLDVLTIAYAVGSLVLSIYISLFKGKKAIILPKESLKHVIIHSTFGMLAVTVSFSYSLKYLDVSIATMLIYTYPIIIALYSILVLKKRFSITKIISVFGTLIGCILVLDIFNAKKFSSLGLCIGIFSAFAYAFLNLYGDKLLKYKLEPVTILFYNCLITFIALIIINNKILFNIKDISPHVFFSSALVSILGQIIPMFLLYIAIKLIGPVLSSIITTIEIPAVAILSFIFLNEKISLIQCVGIFIVLLCILLIEIEKPENENKC
ncbi:DMT family transporter [Clostridium cylindrosporum]|uniref:Permease of the drug/metabolite transporter (DMT) superfamily n=1 Tax=Clostridium cylindrosporum DSM 605 TaxID=1121307 RepID=A0A0J8FZ24_CLOCY|nr:EamA family transporter [Clostridium cylindrosporum]KMT20871.1 permease of the drug/metabolite transporter (DMT) superfamily [Clostridium cylindrosporum DSM 605]